MPKPSSIWHRLTATGLALSLIASTSLVLSVTNTGDIPPLPPSVAIAGKATAPVSPPAKEVSLVAPKFEMWPDRIEATGNVMPWHESSISAEVGGLRLTSVLVNEGDVVKKGQVLARLNAASVETDLDVSNAQLTEAQAVLAQATATLERANRLAPSGGVSRQELTLYETQKHTAEARVNAAQAQVRRQQLKLEFAVLSAPDDGIISYSAASEGSIVQSGSELFRLIRQGRLEWRGEVKGELLMRLTAGQEVTIRSPLGTEVAGRVRRLSATVDMKTRNGLVYVDLPPGTELKAGLNVSGSIVLGKRKAMVVPTAALLKKGDSTSVLRVDADNRLESVEVKTGRSHNDRVEILSGIDEQSRIAVRDVRNLKVGELVAAPVSMPEIAR